MCFELSISIKMILNRCVNAVRYMVYKLPYIEAYKNLTSFAKIIIN